MSLELGYHPTALPDTLLVSISFGDLMSLEHCN